MKRGEGRRSREGGSPRRSLSKLGLRAAALLLALSAAACAHLGKRTPPAQPPDLASWPGRPAPPRGKLYADCLAQSIAAGTYDRVDDGGGHLLRFRCSGAPAAALFAELGAWSAGRHSEWRADGEVFRSTNRVSRNLFGVDYCFSDGAAATCLISLNVGEFLGSPAGGERR